MTLFLTATIFCLCTSVCLIAYFMEKVNILGFLGSALLFVTILAAMIYQSELKGNLEAQKKCTNYLAKERFDLDYVDYAKNYHFKIVYDKNGQELIQFFDPDGELVGEITR